MDLTYQSGTQMSPATIVGCIIAVVIVIVADWMIFKKAGRPGWASIIPFYNLYVEFEVAGMNGWMFLLLLIPFVNIVVTIVYANKLAKAFGKGIGFTLGLLFLSTIFKLILAFGSAQYQGEQK